MKKIGIVYFGDLNELNGVSIVIKLMRSAKSIFQKNGIDLVRIYGKNKIDYCNDNSTQQVQKETSRKKVFKTLIRSFFRRLLNSNIPLFAFLKLQLNLIIPAKKVVRSIEDFEFDCLIFHDVFTAYQYSKAQKDSVKKTILVLHCEKDIKGQVKIVFPGLFKSKRYTKYIDKIFDEAINATNELVFVSSTVANYNKEFFPKSTYIRNGIDNRKSNVLKKINESNEELKIISLGSLNFRKGQDIIIQSLNYLPLEYRQNVKVTLVGDGPQKPELQKLVKRLRVEDYVDILGSRTDVESLIQANDVMVLMSKDEGLPLSLIEGIREGLYIISTDVGGICEIVETSFGELIQRDPLVLAKTIMKLIDQNLVNEVSKKAAQQYFDNNFTVENMINGYSSLIRN